MGVPSFYRWLVNKYPKIVSDAVDDKYGRDHAMEFDNFYLDMNGIIHPCFHPEDNLFPPTTYEEVFGSMYEYIDRLFDIVKPKKLLFMAIDGVAPRAKMNQQRARRFRSAKDNQLTEEMEEKLRKQFENEGKALLPKEESEVADSNVITPGTDFMSELSEKLKCYINERMHTNPFWQNIKVILSDDKVPGEGEHKIMSFIRHQRLLPGYDPNTRHCLYGLDADLIMLALATHEIHFWILREEVLSQDKQPKYETSMVDICHTNEARFLKSREWFKEHPWQKSDILTQKMAETKRQSYQFLNVCILREYLALDLEIPSSDNKSIWDLEKIIDDFIFICFFAGNDFLPHMPTLEIHEGCIDLLMHVYKKEFQNLGGYLVDIEKVNVKKGAYIKLKRVQRYILAVGEYEDKIFTKRSQITERKLRRILSDYMEAKEYEKSQLEEGTSSDIVVMHDIAGFGELKISTSSVDPDTVLNNTKELKQKLKEYTRKQSDLFKDGVFGTDKVKLGSPGFKERYYKEKFSAHSPGEIEATRKTVVAKYGEGLCWVLLYYFSGVPSWTWFYPFHYGPFTSDLAGLTQSKTKFQKGSPFKPFDQLMGVLPPRSVQALPVVYKELMIDQNSSIIDFYPTEFETDVDGKRYIWQGICKLPFIEEDRLLAETRKLENELTETEKIRNMQTLDRLFVRCTSASIRKSFFDGAGAVSEKIKGAMKMESKIEGIKGMVHLMPEVLIGVDNGEDNLCAFFEIPQGSQHLPRLLEGVKVPEKVVSKDDIEETVLWHEKNGNARFQNTKTYQNNQRMREQRFEPRAECPAHPYVSKGADIGFLGRGKSSTSTLASENLASGSHQAYRTSNNHPPLVYKPMYHGPRSGEGSHTRSGYRGAAHQSSGSNSFNMSNNASHHLAGGNFWRSGGSSTPYWRMNNQPVAARGEVQPEMYVQRSGPRQHLHRPFSQGDGQPVWSPRQHLDRPPSANSGRGRGRGRGRGWYATSS